MAPFFMFNQISKLLKIHQMSSRNETLNLFLVKFIIVLGLVV